MADVEKCFGRIDILINNAGDLIERRTLLEMTESRWREVIDLNLTSIFFSLTKAIAKELASHGIRVNCVSPGLIDDTRFHGRFTPREPSRASPGRSHSGGPVSPRRWPVSLPSSPATTARSCGGRPSRSTAGCS